MNRLVCLLLVMPLLAIPACSDDDPAGPAVFKVTVRVLDAAGEPVAGLQLTMLSDNDFLQDDFPDKMGGKAAVAIRWTQPQEGRTRLIIEDIEGEPVATLVDGMMSVGTHAVQWAGRNTEGIHQPSGRYTAHITQWDDQGLISQEKTRDMLMATFSASVGTTDENGQLVLNDRRLFPHLYERPAMAATNENGEIMGSLILTEDMIFRLMDDPQTATVTSRVQIPSGGGIVDMVWDPQVATASPAPGTGFGPTRGDVDVPPIEFELAHPYPNPFN